MELARLLPNFIFIEYDGKFFFENEKVGSYDPAPGVLTDGLSSYNFSPTWNFGFSISKHMDL